MITNDWKCDIVNFSKLNRIENVEVVLLKIYCSYNHEYHIFLNKVVELVLKQYGSDLNISTLKEIELRNINEFEIKTDGRTVSNDKIILTSRLYELLPTLNINCLNDNNDYKLLRQTIYHEMGHINDMVYMPNLYKCVLENIQKKATDINISTSSLFWLEYIAEKRSAGFENVYDLEICDEFVDAEWICSMSSFFSDYNENNFLYLTKILPYFLGRTTHENVRQKYLIKIKNNVLIDYIRELEIELKNLETKGIFDDLDVLNSLYGIIKKYERIFIE